MAQKSNQEQLRNKFLGVEMSLDDSELKYKLSTDKIQQIKKVKDKDFPILFVYGGFLFRTSKIIFSFLAKGLKLIWTEVLAPFVKEIQKTLVYSFRKLSDIKEHGEISLEGYLSKVENDLIIEKENTKIIDQKRDQELDNYEKELTQIFEGINSNVKLTCEKKEFEKVNLSLEFDISLYELMSLKLSNSRMITNVSHLKINSLVDEKSITNTIEFDLKISGEKWSKLFSKHIASEVLSKIENYRGKVKNTHLINSIQKSEKFVLVFTHQRLDLFMDNAMEERVPRKVEKLRNNVQLDV